jgi:hypothetical protein
VPRTVRAEENTARFREVNQRIEQAGARWQPQEHLGFVCECSETGCRATVYLTVTEFREIRRMPGRYVTVTGHPFDEIHERAVLVTDRYTVVESLEEPVQA